MSSNHYSLLDDHDDVLHLMTMMVMILWSSSRIPLQPALRYLPSSNFLSSLLTLFGLECILFAFCDGTSISFSYFAISSIQLFFDGSEEIDSFLIANAGKLLIYGLIGKNTTLLTIRTWDVIGLILEVWGSGIVEIWEKIVSVGLWDIWDLDKNWCSREDGFVTCSSVIEENHKRTTAANVVQGRDEGSVRILSFDERC